MVPLKKAFENIKVGSYLKYVGGGAVINDVYILVAPRFDNRVVSSIIN